MDYEACEQECAPGVRRMYSMACVREGLILDVHHYGWIKDILITTHLYPGRRSYQLVMLASGQESLKFALTMNKIIKIALFCRLVRVPVRRDS